MCAISVERPSVRIYIQWENKTFWVWSSKEQDLRGDHFRSCRAGVERIIATLCEGDKTHYGSATIKGVWKGDRRGLLERSCMG